MSNQYTDRIDAAYDGWAAAHPISFLAAVADFLGYQRACRVVGWSAGENASAVATARLYNGQSVADGILIDTISLIADGADRSMFSDRGILCDRGLFVEIVAGEVNLSLWVRDWVGDAAATP